MNAVFLPMFIQGLAGLNRRLYDGGISYTHGQQLQHWNVVQGWAAWMLGLFQLVFIVNLVVSWRRGEAADNPWQATTLEWAAPSPPPHGNFAEPPRVFRGPYEYSMPGRSFDFSPQHLESAG
jgi:cytochrome c oxidase subunit 1